MKQKLLIILAFLPIALFAQVGTSSLTIFSDEGQPFILLLNGQQQNAQPQNSVTVNNLNSVPYKIRVVFQDASLGALNDKVNLQIGYLQTYIIKKKKVTAIEKGVKHLGNDIAYGVNSKDPVEAQKRREEIENEQSKYVIRMLSSTVMTPVPSNNNPSYSQTPPPQNSAPAQSRVNGSASGNVSNSNTTVHQTTTTTGGATGMNTNANVDGANISMSINVNGMNANTSYSETTTTTTTTSTNTSNIPPSTQTYVMPGYNGPTGCAWPMSDNDFANAKRSISTKSFEDSKLTLAKQIFDHNCLLSAQVKEILTLFDFENTRLEFAKYAYGRTYDIGNYYQVNDAFEFESSISDLNNYTSNYRR